MTTFQILMAAFWTLLALWGLGEFYFLAQRNKADGAP